MGTALELPTSTTTGNEHAAWRRLADGTAASHESHPFDRCRIVRHGLAYRKLSNDPSVPANDGYEGHGTATAEEILTCHLPEACREFRPPLAS